jgi:hypothetical protein
MYARHCPGRLPSAPISDTLLKAVVKESFGNIIVCCRTIEA